VHESNAKINNLRDDLQKKQEEDGRQRTPENQELNLSATISLEEET